MVFWSISALIAALAILAMFWFILTGRPPRIPPGPSGVPFLGAIPAIGKCPWLAFNSMKKQYGNLISMYLGPDLTVVLNDFDAIYTAFVSPEHADNFIGREPPFALKEFSRGRDGKISSIMAQEGPRWKAMRQFITDAWKELGVGQERAERLILDEFHRMENYIAHWNGHAFYMKEVIYNAMVNIVAEVLFSGRFRYNGDDFHKITKRVPEMFTALAGGPISAFPWTRLVIPPIKKLWEGAMWSKDVQYDMFEKELKKHEESFNPARVRDFIDFWIREKNNRPEADLPFKTPDEIIPNLVAMFSAGPEATSTGIEWAVLALCHHPDAQQRMFEEMDQVVGERDIVQSDYGVKLPYTTACLYECLRLSAVGPFGLPRCNIEETELMGYHIPARTTILSNFWASHQDPKYWKSPYSFDPENYLDDGKFVLRPQFLSFSIGKRTCPGRPLAEMMIFLMFANLYHRFEIKPSKDTRLPGMLEFGHIGVSASPPRFDVVAVPRY